MKWNMYARQIGVTYKKQPIGGGKQTRRKSRNHEGTKRLPDAIGPNKSKRAWNT